MWSAIRPDGLPVCSPAPNSPTASGTVMLIRAASWLSEPACQCSELVGRLATLQTLYPHASRVSMTARKIAIWLQVALWAMGALIGSIPAMLLRAIVRRRATGIWRSQEAAERPWQGNRVRLLTWNVCAPAGKYAITDGGVLPWRDRIDRVLHQIRTARADVVCLAEVFDAAAALEMAKILSQTYAHVLTCVGPRAIGVPSGVLIASRGPLTDVGFEAYPKSWLDARTKNAEKGILRFSLPLPAKTLTVLTSHLQHSEKPEFPTPAERQCRARQIARIGQLAEEQAQRGRAVVLTGDLNLEPAELRGLPEGRQLRAGEMLSQEPTWGGDQWCARIEGKQGSSARTLDYTLAWRDTVRHLRTQLTHTGFCGTEFRPQALSDHRGLLSEIAVG
jgi:endonuclease/exonuclease/phosphatase family metal-dependent hydrolase